MLRFQHSSKKAPNLSLNLKAAEPACEMGMNLSQTVDISPTYEVKSRYWEQWNERNEDAVAEYNALIAKYGLPLKKHLTF